MAVSQKEKTRQEITNTDTGNKPPPETGIRRKVSPVSERKAYPLSWPEGWRRTKIRSHALFNKPKAPRYANDGQPISMGKTRLSVADAVRRVLAEIERMGVKDNDIIISTNVPLRLDGMPRSDQEPSDPGVAVYWQKKGQQMRCMAIDRYHRVADNLAAVAATLVLSAATLAFAATGPLQQGWAARAGTPSAAHPASPLRPGAGGPGAHR